jgi:hypothetical protein
MAPLQLLAEIMTHFLGGEGLGTNAIMREAGKSKTCVCDGKSVLRPRGSRVFCATRRDPVA